MTGKAGPGVKYAAATATHSETVLRSFCDFHLEAGSGPMLNPFPLSRVKRAGRANAHHNPMNPFQHESTGPYRPGQWCAFRVPPRHSAGRRPRCGRSRLPASSVVHS
jgi:hypothetical protein